MTKSQNTKKPNHHSPTLPLSLPRRQHCSRHVSGCGGRPTRTSRASFGGKPLVFSQGDDGGGGGDLSLEDAAEVCVRCLGAPPSGGDVIAFEVRNSKAGADGAAKRDWRALFGGLSSTK